ncbi:MAG: hypothetical protein IJ072_06465 [Oscillospiraceae bacterium]|nr:hypothetical protein [Oscillospiraceae bacterium]
MKRILELCLAVFVMFSLIACGSTAPDDSADTPEENQISGPYTNDSDDFADGIPVEVDSSVLETCEEYASSLGYETGSFMKAVLLGDKWIDSVICDDDMKTELIDTKDIVVIFDNIRCVVDAEKEIVLGRIPYV